MSTRTRTDNRDLGGRPPGELTRTFRAAARPAEPPRPDQGRGSEMVRNDKLTMDGGPPPPALTYDAVNRQNFNARWRAEARGFRRMRATMREEFNQSAGTLRNAVVSSREPSGQTPRLKPTFNQAARIRWRR